MDKKNFLTDVQTLRQRARQHIDEGAVTSGYSADRETVLKLLNDSLATEIVCVLRCRRHHFKAKGIQSKSIADEFLLHSNEEQGHADKLAERIAIDRYRDIIRHLGDKDPTTRRMLESIVAVEEERGDELADLLQNALSGLMVKPGAVQWAQR